MVPAAAIVHRFGVVVRDALKTITSVVPISSHDGTPATYRGRSPLQRFVLDLKNWGAARDEIAARFPCDELEFPHDDVFHRAVDVAAPAPLVFRWLCQLRAAPYSYDLLDNFGRRSPPRLTPGLERLERGQRAMVIFRVASFSADELTLRLGSRLAAAIMGDFAGSYRVQALSPERSRLLVRILVRYPAGPYGRALRLLIPPLDLFMFRKQLLTLKRYAERDARAGRTSRSAV
jgi:hypothetical protein